MWKLHRYYLKEVTTTGLLTFLVLFGIVLVASVSRGVDRAQGGNLLSAALITFFWAADTFPHLLAISLLVSTVLTFARASQDREITAIRAAGISPRTPMIAALIIGLTFSVVGSYALHQWIPKAHYYKYRVVGEAVRNFVLNSKMSGGKIALDGFFLSALRKDERGHLWDVVVKLSDKGGSTVDSGGLRPGAAYRAKEAWLDLTADGETLALTLRDIRDAAGEIIIHETLTIGVNLRAISNPERDEDDKDLSSDQLLAEVERGVHTNPNGARFTVHKRACFAMMPALFAPLGFCIGVFARDRGRMTAVLFAMLPMLSFYGGVLAAPTLVRTFDWPPIAWLPALVVAIPGLPFCWRLLRV